MTGAGAVARFLVEVDTPAGPAVLDVPSALGPAAAARRAVWAAVAARWGDVGEIRVTAVRDCDGNDLGGDEGADLGGLGGGAA